MTISTGAVPASPFQAESRRRDLRLSVALPGRYRLATRQDFPCLSVDASLSELSILAPVKAPVGEEVTVYLEQFGRLDGSVARHTMWGMALSLRTTAREREQLVERLNWLEARQRLGLPENRRHVRLAPFHTAVLVTLANGATVATRLIDVSRSGAAVALDPQPPVGAPVLLGTTGARVVRHLEGGVAVEFLTVLPRDRFSAFVIL